MENWKNKTNRQENTEQNVSVHVNMYLHMCIKLSAFFFSSIRNVYVIFFYEFSMLSGKHQNYIYIRRSFCNVLYKNNYNDWMNISGNRITCVVIAWRKCTFERFALLFLLMYATNFRWNRDASRSSAKHCINFNLKVLVKRAFHHFLMFAH